MSDAVKLLDNQTARLITSNQVIQGPYNVVKELVENALDAGATAIDIKLENYGLEKITVKDNAKGITNEDVAVMCRPGYSSKIRDFSDLDTLKSYGFRGEALASICCIAEVSITTKTEDDAVASTYKFDSNGEIVDKSASHLNQGTLVSVQNIFYHQPARRRILINARASANTQGFSKCGTMTKIRSYLGAVGVAWPFVRIFLVHGGALVWKKQSVSAENEPIKTAFGETLGHNLVSGMVVLKSEIDDVGAVTAVLPDSKATINEISTTNKSSIILIINKRVVRHKKIEDVLMEKFREQFPDLSRGRYPACVLDLKVNQEDLDVNLEPDKSKVLLRRQKEDLLLEGLRAFLETVYGVKEAGDSNCESVELEPPPNKKQKTSQLQEKTNQETSEIPTDTHALPPTGKESNKRSDEWREEEGLKIDFFTPALVIPDAEPIISSTVSIEFIQKPRSEAPEKIDLSEASSEDDEAPTVSPENSILCTPDPEKFDDGDFTLTEEDEAALMELEKLMDSSQTSSTEVNQSTEQPVEKPPASFNMSDWSRGRVADESGTEIEGFKILAQPKGSVKHRKPAAVDNREQRLALLASPCTQMGLTNLRAFNMFCKETRPKLLKENKNLGLCEVAPLLARMWKELPAEDKLHFEEQAEEYKINKLRNNSSLLASPVLQIKPTKKKSVGEPSSPAANLCMSMLKSAAEKKLSQSASGTLQLEPQENQTSVSVVEISTKKDDGKISSQSESSAAQEKQTSLSVVEIISKKEKSPSQEARKKKQEKTVEISLTLDQIMQKKLDRLHCISKFSGQIRLIGPYNKGWLVRMHDAYSLIIPWKIRETLNFQRLMNDYAFPSTILKPSIRLDENSLSTSAWNYFNKMLANDPCSLSSVLRKNGFEVDSANALLTHTSNEIENYGLADLQELLELLCEQNKCDINCRTTKIKLFLKDKCKEPGLDMNRQETLELLKNYLLSHDLQELCPHGNSAAIEVHREIIKLSQ